MSGQEATNLNLARMELLASKFTSSARGRRALLADFRIMNQEMGSLTRAGDTISVILRGDNRCVPFNGNFEYGPRPGLSHLYYFTSLDPTGGLASEGYESPLSRYRVTEAHPNEKSIVNIFEDSITIGFGIGQERVPYATYIADLKACAGLICARPAGISDLRIFPNPASEHLSIAWEGTATGIELLDITGMVHSQATIDGLQYRHEFNVSRLSPGVYIVKLTSAEGVVARKVMVN